MEGGKEREVERERERDRQRALYTEGERQR